MRYTVQQFEQFIEEQRDYFNSGATKSLQFRKNALLKLKNKLKQEEHALLQALQKDLGKSGFESYATEIGIVYDSINFMLKNLHRWMKREAVKTPITLMPAKSFIVREPYGSVLIIAPFNYPVQLTMEPLLGAIIGGNCAIVKPSDITPHTTEAICRIIEETFDPKYIRVLEVEREDMPLLVQASFDYIFFTGSVAVGKLIMKAAADRLTPITLELGGKSPAIIEETAKLAIAADRIVWGKFVNVGQTCVAPDYILVHESIKESFVKELKRAIHQFYGENIEQSEDYGRIINVAQVNRLKAIIEKDQGFQIYGGEVNEEARYISPTLIENATWDSAAMQEELFGPILPILTYSNLTTAIEHVKKNPKPLAAYFFSENKQAMELFLQNLSFGGGCINDTLTHVGNTQLPFGGVGQSGMNAYHGKYSFEAFTHAKSIVQKDTKFHLKLLFPPYGNRIELLRKLLK